MKKRNLFLSFFLLTIFNVAGQDYDEILKKADFLRGGQVEGIAWNIKVINIKNGKEKDEIRILVEASASENQQFNLATFLKPKKYVGQKILLRNNSMWFIKKGLRRPIAISSRQRLSGSASNADIATTNYYKDYNIASKSSETLEDKEYWKLTLKAKNNLVSYSEIIYWIDKKTGAGFKSSFYGKSGKRIKDAFFEYENTITYNEKKYDYLSKITILDNVNKEDSTVITISNPIFKTFNNAKFQKNALLE